jgi:hypothetical protein
MSNREALRKLSRKFPAPPEIAQTLEALDHEPDRSAAIVGAGLLETALREADYQKPKEIPPHDSLASYSKIVGRLSHKLGPPLGSFSSDI